MISFTTFTFLFKLINRSNVQIFHLHRGLDIGAYSKSLNSSWVLNVSIILQNSEKNGIKNSILFSSLS